VIDHHARSAAHAALFPGFNEAGMHALAEPHSFLLGDRGENTQHRVAKDAATVQVRFRKASVAHAYCARRSRCCNVPKTPSREKRSKLQNSTRSNFRCEASKNSFGNCARSPFLADLRRRIPRKFPNPVTERRRGVAATGFRRPGLCHESKLGRKGPHDGFLRESCSFPKVEFEL
jgi:hypothetical protein